MVVAQKKNEQRPIEKVFNEEEKWRSLTSEFRAYTKAMRRTVLVGQMWGRSPFLGCFLPITVFTVRRLPIAGRVLCWSVQLRREVCRRIFFTLYVAASAITHLACFRHDVTRRRVAALVAMRHSLRDESLSSERRQWFSFQVR